MPNVRMILPGTVKRAALPTHRKVTLSGYAGVVTFDIADPKVDFDGLADEWEEEARPGGRPILSRVGPRLRTLDLRVLFGTGRVLDAAGQERPADDAILVLAALASPINTNAKVNLAYSTFESSARIARGGGWVITNLRGHSVRRRQGDNRITRAELTITLTEASRPSMPAPTAQAATTGAPRVGPPPSNPAASPTPRADAPAVAAPPRRYTVRAGDTLYGIAARLYGDGNRWPAIADANGIRDPRRLRIGQDLTIP